MMLLAVALAAVPAASEARLEPGRYRVEVLLELPHLSAADATKDVTICVDDMQTPPRHLASCPPIARLAIARSKAG